MPASTTTLSKVAAGAAFNEQASDVSPGNKFLAQPKKTRLYARNKTVGAIELIFEADKYGAEKELRRISVPGSGTENGVHITEPFEAEMLDHGTTEVASNGYVFVRQATGSDGDVVLCPFD